jgi:aromatic-L-amino-acid decarboxylase
MMKNIKSDEFRKQAYQFVDWMADYMDSVENYPVKSRVQPGEIALQINNGIPIQGEEIDQIFKDFKEIILPGITHWQSPNFFAYFPANSSSPSILAEMLIATLGVQGMKWDTSPASTELEEKMTDWLKQALGLPDTWSGVIQDSASSSTLVSILTAREQKSGYGINSVGYKGVSNFRVYCSTEAHSSVEKGAKIAGIGANNVVKIPTDKLLRMQPNLLLEAIEHDFANGYQPLCIVAAIGSTGTLAIDPLNEIAEIAQKFNIWLHVDAAYAGSALILPEYQGMIKGIENADSFVFNPHKWLFTNFDCSVYFVKDKQALVNTFSILPEYLKSKSDSRVNNHCDWGIPLGRRFRSLKLWFVLRYYGLEGLQNTLRHHIELAHWLENEILKSTDFIFIVPRFLNVLCFCYTPQGVGELNELNRINEQLLQTLNATGKMYMTHTKVNGIYTLRMVVAQTNVAQKHVENAWELIRKTAKEMV